MLKNLQQHGQEQPLFMHMGATSAPGDAGSPHARAQDFLHSFEQQSLSPIAKAEAEAARTIDSTGKADPHTIGNTSAGSTDEPSLSSGIQSCIENDELCMHCN